MLNVGYSLFLYGFYRFIILFKWILIYSFGRFKLDEFAKYVVKEAYTPLLQC